MKIFIDNDIQVILDKPQEYLYSERDFILIAVQQPDRDFLVMGRLDEDGKTPHICLEDDKMSECFYPTDGETLMDTCIRAIRKWCTRDIFPREEENE